LCIDIYDNFSLFKFKGNKRINYYKNNGYKINTYIDEELVVSEEEPSEKGGKCAFIEDDD
jgi:hypothetical protein